MPSQENNNPVNASYVHVFVKENPITNKFDAKIIDVQHVSNILGSAQDTSRVKININLGSSTKIFEGASQIISLKNASIYNQNIYPKDIIFFEEKFTDEITLKIIHNDLDYNKKYHDQTDVAYSYKYGGIVNSKNINGTSILGSNSTISDFSKANLGDRFNITSNDFSATYMYVPAKDRPIVARGEFSNLNELANVINITSHLTSRVIDNKLFIAAVNSSTGLSFIDLRGSFVEALGLYNISDSINRFSNFIGLGNLINESNGFLSSVTNNTKTPELKFHLKDQSANLEIDSNLGEDSLISKFNLTRNELSSTYDPLSKNMASKAIRPHYSKSIEIFASGKSHILFDSYLKIFDNIWAVELYLKNPNETIFQRQDGLVSYGFIEFKNGLINYISKELDAPIYLLWADNSRDSYIRFDRGHPILNKDTPFLIETIGVIEQYNKHELYSIEQDGKILGMIMKSEFDEEGNIIIYFSNGQNHIVHHLLNEDFFKQAGLDRNLYIHNDLLPNNTVELSELDSYDRSFLFPHDHQ